MHEHNLVQMREQSGVLNEFSKWYNDAIHSTLAYGYHTWIYEYTSYCTLTHRSPTQNLR